MANDLSTASGRRRVVIIGAGFGGIYAAQQLAKHDIAITIVDRRNHHLFQPLLYQVASAALNPSDIAYPIRSIFRGRPQVEVQLAEVLRIETASRRVVLDDGALTYDRLIVATGATHSYFGHDAWAAHAPGLKTVEDALEIRRRVLLAFEAAERESDPVRRKEWLTFVVVGAGPTGAELAGALAEIARQILGRDFRHVAQGEFRVVLVEAGPRVLSSFPPALSAAAQRALEGLGVEVRVGEAVTAIDGAGLNIGSTRFGARTVLWAAGVAASGLGATLGVPSIAPVGCGCNPTSRCPAGPRSSSSVTWRR